MIKMPVTRFTVPRSKQQGLQWYELLNGVYCTFTIVSKNGRVVACIDVPNRLGISRRNHEVNGSLLKQCGIPYLSANPARLTSVQNIRAELLTERPRPARESGRDSSQEDTREVGQEGAPIRAASDNLRASLMQQRSIRNSDFSQLSHNPVSILDDIGDTMSRFSPNWNDNSFIAPLDSRRAELQ